MLYAFFRGDSGHTDRSDVFDDCRRGQISTFDNSLQAEPLARPKSINCQMSKVDPTHSPERGCVRSISRSIPSGKSVRSVFVRCAPGRPGPGALPVEFTEYGLAFAT